MALEKYNDVMQQTRSNEGDERFNERITGHCKDRSYGKMSQEGYHKAPFRIAEAIIHSRTLSGQERYE